MTENTQQTDQYEEYLPFNAINEFMRDDYRLIILHETITHLNDANPEQQKEISKLISQYIKIPGFRKSNLAPAPMKAKNAVVLFQQSAAFSSKIVETWSSLHPKLKETVWTVLTEKGWEPAPIDIDRTVLPGFQTHWPKADTFEAINTAVRALAPDLSETDDDISLMAVWIGNRLPYDLFIDETPGDKETK